MRKLQVTRYVLDTCISKSSSFKSDSGHCTDLTNAMNLYRDRIHVVTHGSDFFDSTEQLLLHRNCYEILLQNSVATRGLYFFPLMTEIS